MTESVNALLGCGVTISATEADVAAGLEILAGIKRAQIELRGCRILRRCRRLLPISPICGSCLVLWQRCSYSILQIDAADRYWSRWGGIAGAMCDMASITRNLPMVSRCAPLFYIYRHR